MELVLKNKNTRSLKFVFFILILSSTLFFDSKIGFNGFVPVGVSCSILLAILLDIIKVRLIDYIIVVFLLIFAFGTLVLTYGYWYSDLAQIKNFFSFF